MAFVDLLGRQAMCLGAVEATELAITSTAAPTPTPTASPTALELNHWGLRRGCEILEDSERIQQTLLVVGLIGGVTESFAVFGIALAALLIASVVAGDIRR